MRWRDAVPEEAISRAKRLRATLRTERARAQAIVRTRRDLPAILSGPVRRVELGGGHYPTPGYVHIDRDPTAPIDVYASADDLPLPDGWAERLLAVHVLEHIPAFAVPAVLAEWRRVLEPGAVVDLHVPNGASLARVLLANEHDLDPTTYWPATGALFGYFTPLAASSPTDLGGQVEHCVMYTPASLAAVLEAAGFEHPETGPHECRHTGPWDRTVPDLCLRMTARRR